jgi:hypothetical protein
LYNAGLIEHPDLDWVVQKKVSMMAWLEQHPETLSSPLNQKILDNLAEDKSEEQIKVKIMMQMNKYENSLFESVIKELEQLCDNENLLQLYQYQLQHTKKLLPKCSFTKI